jgi:hypothetical protein
MDTPQQGRTGIQPGPLSALLLGLLVYMSWALVLTWLVTTLVILIRLWCRITRRPIYSWAHITLQPGVTYLNMYLRLSTLTITFLILTDFLVGVVDLSATLSTLFVSLVRTVIVRLQSVMMLSPTELVEVVPGPIKFGIGRRLANF